jgi:hypothetical protein
MSVPRGHTDTGGEKKQCEKDKEKIWNKICGLRENEGQGRAGCRIWLALIQRGLTVHARGVQRGGWITTTKRSLSNGTDRRKHMKAEGLIHDERFMMNLPDIWRAGAHKSVRRSQFGKIF